MSAFVVRPDAPTAACGGFVGSPLADLLLEMGPFCGIVYGATSHVDDYLGGRMTWR
jgi:hypothetical protein